MEATSHLDYGRLEGAAALGDGAVEQLHVDADVDPRPLQGLACFLGHRGSCAAVGYASLVRFFLHSGTVDRAAGAGQYYLGLLAAAGCLAARPSPRPYGLVHEEGDGGGDYTNTGTAYAKQHFRFEHCSVFISTNKYSLV